MNTSFGEFRRNQRGAATIVVAFALPLLVAGIGATVTYSQATSVRSELQKALDASVIAGTTLPIGTSNADRIRAAESVFATQTKGATAGWAGKGAAQFEVVRVASDDVRVVGSATAAVKNSFGGLIGSETVPVSNTSAAQKATSDPICLLALNSRDQGSIDLNGAASVTAGCPVQANSGSGSGVRQVGDSRMVSSLFNTSGGFKGTNFSPPPTPNSPRVHDPYASLPFPPLGSCLELGAKAPNGKIQSANVTLSPGTYCGGLEISSGSVVRLEPGIYVFKGGSVKISGSRVTGSEVVLAFADGTASNGAIFELTGGADVKLTSPSTGTYMNMQFIEDQSITSTNRWVWIGGDSKLDFDGAMYVPRSSIWIFGGSTVTGRSPTMIMLADHLWFQDTSRTTLTQVNTRGLPVTDASRVKHGAKLVN